jgi:hypothetical protein
MGETFPADRARNQSGLSVGYTSGVTDFDTYIASNPTTFHGSGSNIWSASAGVLTGNFDFALGGSYLLDGMALWNLIGDSSAIRDFNLLLADNPSFSGAVTVGSFTALNNLGSGSNAAAQVFTFNPTAASFVRLEIQNTWDASAFAAAFNEAAFRGAPVAPVPEPATCSLVLSGMLALALRRIVGGRGSSVRGRIG